jgi:hypothetical protein
MLRLIDSLSLFSAAILIGVVSTALVGLLVYVLPKVPGWIWVLSVPFTLAYCFYWSPVWFGSGDSSSFSAWAIAFIAPCFFAGFFPSALLVWILEKRRAK